MAKARIMIVEDERIIAGYIKRILQDMGYAVSKVVSSGEEAIKKAQEDNPDLVLMDIILQGEMDGIEAASQIRSRFNIPVLYLTAYTNKKMLERAKITEPFGYIVKPFQERELHSNIEMALYKHKTERKLKESYAQLQRTMGGIIDAMTMMVELRNPFIAGHQHRVAQLASAIAKEMGLSEHQIKGAWLAATIHDIGLINVPFEVFSKPSRLSGTELEYYKIHPKVGYDILENIEFPWPIAQIVLQHHEMMDGSGYPQGLSGEDILLEARILAVANVVESMSFHRPSRAAPSMDKVLEEVSKGRGILYDPAVVDICLMLFSEKGFKFE
jgi:putative two-component system response regulator